MASDIIEGLVGGARLAAERAFAPYSRFPVGAAVMDAEGRVFVGCNVESASYGLSLCAERVALFSALAQGAARPFRALAVACPAADPEVGDSGRMPCGACRQVMAEHLAPEAEVQVDGVGSFRLDALLPAAFRLL